jgi:ABC-2 type transport system permease protein
MNDFMTLKVLDRFQVLFEKFGVNYIIMRRILHFKLTMDGRRVPTIIVNAAGRQNTEGEDQNKFLRSMWLYLFMGVLALAPAVMLGDHFIFQMSLVFGIVIFMVMTSLISDFSAVLLDMRDKNILGSKPVGVRTIHAAKVIHVSIYLFFITGALGLAPLIGGSIRHGLIFFFIFLFEMVLVDIFVVVLTALLYLVVLQFFDGEKLKDMINYVQIGLTLVMAIGYQFISRLFSIVDFNYVFEGKWWQYFIIPVWFAAPFELFIHGDHSKAILTFSLMAVLVPIIAVFIYVKYMPSFERNLQKLTNNSGKRNKGGSTNRIGLSKLLCSNHLERVFFNFTLDMIRNERDFKLRVYPSLGLSFIFPFIFLFNFLQFKEWGEISSSKSYLLMYAAALFIPNIIMMLKYSDSYKGAWIYQAMPVQDLSPIFKGSLKAILVKLGLPLFILVSVVFVVIYGVRIIPDIVILLLSICSYTVISFRILRKALPFSEPFQVAGKGETISLIILMGILALFVGGHFLSTLISYGVYIYLVLLIIVNIFSWRRAF